MPPRLKDIAYGNTDFLPDEECPIPRGVVRFSSEQMAIDGDSDPEVRETYEKIMKMLAQKGISSDSHSFDS